MRNLTRLFLGKDAAARAVTTQARRLFASRNRAESAGKPAGVESAGTREAERPELPIKEHLCAEHSEVRVVPKKMRTGKGGTGMGEAATRLRVEKGGGPNLGRGPMANTLKPSDLSLTKKLQVPEPLDSGVFVTSQASAGTKVPPEASSSVEAAARQVTLIVYEWHNVEPGTLWWVFPSVQAARSAARAMKNAVKWAIVAGRRTAKIDVEQERESGHVLAEQAG